MFVFRRGQQNGEVDTSEQEFNDLAELSEELAQFAGIQGRAARDPRVRELVAQGVLKPKIQEPEIPGGIGPDITFVIKEVILVPA